MNEILERPRWKRVEYSKTQIITAGKVRIVYYKTSQAENANAAYTQIEKNRVEAKIDAVLVSVSSFQTLKKAYPNYFSDIGEFVTIIKNEIAKYKKYSKKGLEEN